MKQTLLIAFLLAGLAGSLCIAQTKPKKPIAPTSEILTNASILNLHKAGFDDDVIISKIGNSQTNVDLSTDKLIELKNGGISNAVIKALLNKSDSKVVKPVSENIKATAATSPETSLDLLNYPYYFDKALNAYKPVEKAVATSRMKRKALGLGGIDIIFEMDAAKSPIRLSQNDVLSFTINTGGNSLPDMTLHKLSSEKGKRYATVTKVDPLGTAKSGTDIANFSTSILKPGLYKISVSQKLVPGEYFFASKTATNAGTATTASSSTDVYAFGID